MMNAQTGNDAIALTYDYSEDDALTVHSGGTTIEAANVSACHLPEEEEPVEEIFSTRISTSKMTIQAAISEVRMGKVRYWATNVHCHATDDSMGAAHALIRRLSGMRNNKQRHAAIDGLCFVRNPDIPMDFQFVGEDGFKPKPNNSIKRLYLQQSEDKQFEYIVQKFKKCLKLFDWEEDGIGAMIEGAIGSIIEPEAENPLVGPIASYSSTGSCDHSPKEGPDEWAYNVWKRKGLMAGTPTRD